MCSTASMHRRHFSAGYRCPKGTVWNLVKSIDRGTFRHCQCMPRWRHATGEIFNLSIVRRQSEKESRVISHKAKETAAAGEQSMRTSWRTCDAASAQSMELASQSAVSQSPLYDIRSQGLHCIKNVRISTDILWRVFQTVTGTGSVFIRLYPQFDGIMKTGL